MVSGCLVSVVILNLFWDKHGFQRQTWSAAHCSTAYVSCVTLGSKLASLSQTWKTSSSAASGLLRRNGRRGLHLLNREKAGSWALAPECTACCSKPSCSRLSASFLGAHLAPPSFRSCFCPSLVLPVGGVTSLAADGLSPRVPGSLTQKAFAERGAPQGGSQAGQMSTL